MCIRKQYIVKIYICPCTPIYDFSSKVCELLRVMILLADPQLALLVLIEIAIVTGIAARRHEARLQRLIVDLHPVGLVEPLVLLHVRRPVLQVPVSPRQVYLQQILQKILEVLVEEGRTAVLARGYLLVDLHGIVRVERRVARVHLVDEHPEAPPVDVLSVTLGQDYLRR